MTPQEVIEAALTKRALTQQEIAVKRGLTPQALGQKILKDTLRASEFLDILDNLDIEVNYTLKEDGQPLKFRRAGHGRRTKGMSNSLKFDTMYSDALANTFYADGVNEYGEDGVAQELYIDKDGRYFIVEYNQDDPEKDKIHAVHSNIASAFVNSFGPEIEKGPKKG